MTENVFLEPLLDIWFLQNLEIGDILHDKEDVLGVCRDQELVMVVEVADNLEHEVQTPHPVHAHGHEHHEAEWHDQRENH